MPDVISDRSETPNAADSVDGSAGYPGKWFGRAGGRPGAIARRRRGHSVPEPVVRPGGAAGCGETPAQPPRVTPRRVERAAGRGLPQHRQPGRGAGEPRPPGARRCSASPVERPPCVDHVTGRRPGAITGIMPPMQREHPSWLVEALASLRQSAAYADAVTRLRLRVPQRGCNHRGGVSIATHQKWDGTGKEQTAWM